MRILGVDLARGFALVAVFVAHTAPIGGDSPLGIRWLQLSDHVAAPLFTLLLGVSAGLASRASATAIAADTATATATDTVSAPDRVDARRAFRCSFALRGILLVALGLLAGLAGAQVIPILHYLGVVSLLLVPVLFLRARWLLLLAAVTVIVSAVAMPLALSVQLNLIVDAATGGFAWGDQTAATLIGFFFSDYGYRVSGLLAFALTGLAVSKVALTTRRGLVGLGLAGALLIAVALVGFAVTGGSLVPYSGTAPELLKAVGLACLALAVCCGLASTPVARLLAPVSALGSVTLTFYLAHIAVLGMWAHLTSASDDSWPLLLGLCAGSLLGAWLLRRRWRRGPAEWLVWTLTRAPVRRPGRSWLPPA